MGNQHDIVFSIRDIYIRQGHQHGIPGQSAEPSGQNVPRTPSKTLSL